MPAKVANSPQRPHPTAVYARTGKGVLSFKNGTAKVSSELKDLFSSIDGKASVAELCAETQMDAEEVEEALVTLEKKGYIKVFKEGAEQAVPDFTEAPGPRLHFAGQLAGNQRARSSAKAKADADAARACRGAGAGATGSRIAAARRSSRRRQADAAAQREALEARIQELEAEADALRRARNEAVKAAAQAKTLGGRRAQARSTSRRKPDSRRKRCASTGVSRTPRVAACHRARDSRTDRSGAARSAIRSRSGTQRRRNASERGADRPPGGREGRSPES